MNIKKHIHEKKEELKDINHFWDLFQLFHKEVKLSTETYREVRTKTSSKMNQIERSINDHEKLI